MINVVMNINRVTIRNVNLFFQINAFVEKFADMQMISLIDFFSKYDQLSFDKRNRNFISFMTSFELLRIITFFQETINSIEQFVRVANHILNVYISEKCQTFRVIVQRVDFISFSFHNEIKWNFSYSLD